MRKENYLITAAIILIGWLVSVPAQNPIQVENTIRGTKDWQIANAAGNHEVEGYASHTSVNKGETINFHLRVNTTGLVNLDIYRLGYYSGKGGRLIVTIPSVPVSTQPFPVPNTSTGLAECNWPSPALAMWAVPTDTVSGVYVVKLTAQTGGYQSYISFVVRDDARVSDLLYQRSVTTDQAYNNYPGVLDSRTSACDPGQAGSPCPAPVNGKSLYQFNSYGVDLAPANLYPYQSRQGKKVSFNRPYGNLGSYAGIYDTAGTTLFQYDVNMIRWLEKQGYDVTYSTNIDTHTADATNGRLSAGRHKAFLSVGHDEYWSWEMRDNLEQARNRLSLPLNLGFFSANTCYWQVRLEPSTGSGTLPAGAANRTMVGYKELARVSDSTIKDPLYMNGNSADDYLISDKWRFNVQKPPEDELIGVMWSLDPPFCCTWNTVIISPSAPGWITNGMTGQTLDGLLGNEADHLFETNIYNDRALQTVAVSPFYPGTSPTPSPSSTPLGDSHMTFYTRNNNTARVFATGTIQWAWGLDNYNADLNIGPVVYHLPYQKTDAQILTTNVLNCLINGVCS